MVGLYSSYWLYCGWPFIWSKTQTIRNTHSGGRGPIISPYLTRVKEKKTLAQGIQERKIWILSLVKDHDLTIRTSDDGRLVVGELYISNEWDATWGYQVRLGPDRGNSMSSSWMAPSWEDLELNSPLDVAFELQKNYPDYWDNCRKLAAPIPQSYLDMCRGTEL